MKIRITESALKDLYRSRIFYENQKPGLGNYFYKEIFKDIDSLINYNSIHPVVNGFFRLLSNKFPYAVYYKTDNSSIIIYRILDMRQNPEKTKESLF